MIFAFEVSNHLFNVADMVIKTVNIICFFCSPCSKSSFSNGADGYDLSVLCSFYIVQDTQICLGKALFLCDGHESLHVVFFIRFQGPY